MVNLLFDYDGTLHDTLHIYAPSLQEVFAHLVAAGHAEERRLTREEMQRFIGYTREEMWASFLPDASLAVREAAGQRVGELMAEKIAAGEARLYPGAVEVLTKLQAMGHRLIFLSNCRREYLAAHNAAFNLDRYFTALYCAEDYDFRPKHEIFKGIAREHPGDYLVIGDRLADMEITAVHGLPAIGCGYGYGAAAELTASTVIVNDVSEITLAIKKILT